MINQCLLCSCYLQHLWLQSLHHISLVYLIILICQLDIGIFFFLSSPINNRFIGSEGLLLLQKGFYLLYKLRWNRTQQVYSRKFRWTNPQILFVWYYSQIKTKVLIVYIGRLYYFYIYTIKQQHTTTKEYISLNEAFNH